MLSAFRVQGSQPDASQSLKLRDITSIVENQVPQAPGANRPGAIGCHPRSARREPRQETPKISPQGLRLIAQIDHIRDAVWNALDSSDSDDEFARMEFEFRAMKESFQSGSHVQATHAQLDEQAIRRTEDAKHEGRDTAEHRRLNRLRKGRSE